jgi:hypothetical protein
MITYEDTELMSDAEVAATLKRREKMMSRLKMISKAALVIGLCAFPAALAVNGATAFALFATFAFSSSAGLLTHVGLDIFMETREGEMRTLSLASVRHANMRAPEPAPDPVTAPARQLTATLNAARERDRQLGIVPGPAPLSHGTAFLKRKVQP